MKPQLSMALIATLMATSYGCARDEGAGSPESSNTNLAASLTVDGDTILQARVERAVEEARHDWIDKACAKLIKEKDWTVRSFGCVSSGGCDHKHYDEDDTFKIKKTANQYSVDSKHTKKNGGLSVPDHDAKADLACNPDGTLSGAIQFPAHPPGSHTEPHHIVFARINEKNMSILICDKNDENCGGNQHDGVGHAVEN